jgi:arginine decarboxylase
MSRLAYIVTRYRGIFNFGGHGMTGWEQDKARETYGIPHWSGGYFDVNGAGHLIARPDRNQAGPGIDCYELVGKLRQSGLTLPVLVRFTDILRDRVDVLCHAFQRAMVEDDYRGGYTAVYPIKVNQQRSVVEEILRHGGRRVGLEVGSKPELLAVLALSDAEGGTVVCNGYKDREYVRLALIGLRLGLRIFIVVEKLSELELVIEESQALGIAPLLGVRVRLASIGAGKWQNTGGEKAKFGLSAAQILRVVQRLQEADMIGALQMIHFHMGSQVANIRDVQRSMRECARHYAELRALDVDIRYVDVGGGLGIDYEGSRSRSDCSMNYGVQEYANDVVHALWEICEEQSLPHPHIITESGRAMTAHHAALFTQVIDQEQAPAPREVTAASDDEPQIIHNLWQGLNNVRDGGSARSLVEAWHDAAYWLAEAHGMYQHGVITLEQRARIEELYFAVCQQVRSRLQPGVRAHREVLDDLNEKLADKYFCNFSLFQSLPDAWGIDQVFPVLPLHRLNEAPTRRAVLQDITCDSDGRIDHYIDHDSLETTLPVHALRPGEPYVLGIFLLGAYQEILGDLHNLFGDTDSVNVELLPDGSYRLSAHQQGDTVDRVLRYVNFDTLLLREAYQAKLDAADLSGDERARYADALDAGLAGYTYLEE